MLVGFVVREVCPQYLVLLELDNLDQQKQGYVVGMLRDSIVGLYELEADDVAGHWVVEKVRSCYRRGRPRVSRRTG